MTISCHDILVQNSEALWLEPSSLTLFAFFKEMLYQLEFMFLPPKIFECNFLKMFNESQWKSLWENRIKFLLSTKVGLKNLCIIS